MSRIIALLERGANPNIQDNDGKTPLHFAAQLDNPTLFINTLLQNGADPNIKDNEGNKTMIEDDIRKYEADLTPKSHSEKDLLI